MKYYIFTDGATNSVNNDTATGYTIRTKEDFICMGGSNIGEGHIGIAEVQAIIDAINALRDRIVLMPTDFVVIETDSKRTIERFKCILDGKEPEVYGAKYVELKNILMDLNKTCHWKFIKVYSHKEENNENKLADRLAKYYMNLKR